MRSYEECKCHNFQFDELFKLRHKVKFLLNLASVFATGMDCLKVSIVYYDSRCMLLYNWTPIQNTDNDSDFKLHCIKAIAIALKNVAIIVISWEICNSPLWMQQRDFYWTNLYWLDRNSLHHSDIRICPLNIQMLYLGSKSNSVITINHR